MLTRHDRRVVYAQNVLRSPHLVDRLLDRSSIGADDLVIEIGPGRGIITERLAARCRQVLAVEHDPELLEALHARFATTSNVALFAGDFLSFPLPLTTYKVFANIPFNITTAIVGKLTSGTSPPADAYLAMQREAADRFLGIPGETLVAVLLKPWFEPEVTHVFRRGDFQPIPAVDVVLLHLRWRATPLVAWHEAALFADFTTSLFTAWQPTVGAALARLLPRSTVEAIARTSGVRLNRPPSTIPFAEWLVLASSFSALAGERRTAVHGARARLERQQDGLQKVHRTRRSHPYQARTGSREQGRTGHRAERHR